MITKEREKNTCPERGQVDARGMLFLRHAIRPWNVPMNKTYRGPAFMAFMILKETDRQTFK